MAEINDELFAGAIELLEACHIECPEQQGSSYAEALARIEQGTQIYIKTFLASNGSLPTRVRGDRYVELLQHIKPYDPVVAALFERILMFLQVGSLDCMHEVTHVASELNSDIPIEKAARQVWGECLDAVAILDTGTFVLKPYVNVPVVTAFVQNYTKPDASQLGFWATLYGL